MLGTQSNTVVYFEIPNGEYSFRGQTTWNVFYERYAYFTAQTLTRIFDECGFEVLHCGPCYADGQYLSIEATPRYAGNFTRPLTGAVVSQPENEVAQQAQPATIAFPFQAWAGADSGLPEVLVAYAEQIRQKIEMWKTYLAEFNRAKARVVAWGSGGQGITFLNLVQANRRVAYVVDINPERQGKFVPGYGQRVVAPEFLHSYRPDVILITNPTYEAEIKQQVAALGLDCQFMVT